jgi:hypothetical protein
MWKKGYRSKINGANIIGVKDSAARKIIIHFNPIKEYKGKG